MSRSGSEASKSETNTFSSSLTQDVEQAEEQAKQDVEEVELDVKKEFKDLKNRIESAGCNKYKIELKDEQVEHCLDLLKDSIGKLHNGENNKEVGELWSKADKTLKSQMTKYRKNNLKTYRNSFNSGNSARKREKQKGGARSKKKKHSKKHRKNSRKKSRSMKRIKKLKK